MKTSFGPIVIGAQAIDAVDQWWIEFGESVSSVHILVDSNTLQVCAHPFLAALPHFPEVQFLEVDPGEESKSPEVLAQLWVALAEQGADRKSLLIGLGGGVVTDITGMLSATFMRGIRHMLVPTSLLAMVDAAIGGKNGINVMGAKNLAGTFKASELTAVWPAFLETLPEDDWRQGLAEAIKHALLAGGDLWASAKSWQSADQIMADLELLIQVKVDVVEADATEQGLRKQLNLGHTIGHALEAVTGGVIPHGDAVAAGIWMECWIAAQRGWLTDQERQSVHDTIDRHWPRLTWEGNLWTWMQLDKKREADEVYMSLLVGIGQGAPAVTVQAEEVQQAIATYGLRS